MCIGNIGRGKTTLYGIKDNKTPGVGWFSSYFFKRSWEIIHEKVYLAILEFFQDNKMQRSINNTIVTLVPKYSHPENIKDFRPIACCTTLYKIISKIISNRIKGVLEGIVG